MEYATLYVNLGLLVLTAITTAIAWGQAIIASRQRAQAVEAQGKAEKARQDAIKARDASVDAQKAAAGALEDANDIAREAKRIVERAEARNLEHHNVRWEPVWSSSEGRWCLANRGPDIPRDVEVTAYNRFMGHMEPERAAEVQVGEGLCFDFPEYKGAGGFPQVAWDVAWRTPQGSLRQASGRWP